MKKQTISIALLVLVALAFMMMFWRTCRNPKSEIRNPKSVTVDTLSTLKPDTGWHVPTLPPAKPPTYIPQQAAKDAEHYRQRYEHYKKEWAKQGETLGRLSALLAEAEKVGDCPTALAALQGELAMWRDQGRADSAYIAALNELASLRNYAGQDSTADWVHHYDITVLGELPAGGYRYKTDFVQRTIERTVTLPPAQVWRRRSVAALYGIGADGRAIYAAEGRLQGKRLGLAGLVGWDGAALGMAGVVWQW